MVIPLIFPYYYRTLPPFKDPPFNAWLRKFLREPKYSSISHVSFDYYGGRWRIDCFVGVSLYWVSSSKECLEYKSSWNDWRNDKRSVLHIMMNHPNLDRVRHELGLAGKLKDAPSNIKIGR